MKPYLNRDSIRFVTLFFLLVLGFTYLIRIPFVDRTMVLPYTVWIANFTSLVFDFLGVEVTSQGTILHHANFSVDIRRGCDGVVASIILISACLAYPASWKHRLFGLIWGFGLIFVLNLFRILVLFSLGFSGWMRMFHFVHTYVAQFIVIASAMVFWIYWAGRRTANSREAT